eukprot:2914606-Pyramimonas_sp.AAC.1
MRRNDEEGPYVFQQLLDQLLMKCRTSQVTPLAWHRSISFDADKNNGKPGIGGKRIMHAYGSMSMAWHW